MALLEDPIYLFPDSAELQVKISNGFWGPPPKRLFNCEPGSQVNLNTYFRYYHHQCQLASHDYGNHVSLKTHSDIHHIAGSLKTSKSREVLRAELCEGSSAEEKEKMNGSIDLAARLLLMISIGKLQFAFSGQRHLAWETGSLADFVHNYFGAAPKLGHDAIKLEKDFNARNLSRIAGVQIVWTDDLACHLRMSDEDSRVNVFHHACFLERQHNSAIFPPGFIDETLRTLALLFPQSDEHTRRSFQASPLSDTLDPRIIRCGHLRADDRRIENFTFWHDRLVILKQLFDEARPKTLSQWYYDRRNGVQWYTFWVAVLVLLLTLLFGFIQCIEGALQVYEAYHPSRV